MKYGKRKEFERRRNINLGMLHGSKLRLDFFCDAYIRKMNKLAGNLHKGIFEAGCDEAGRGCLAGPVVAAAVILPEGWRCKGLNDSKLLSVSQREKLKPIIENEALAWGIGICGPSEIDTLNILQASFEAMHRAVWKLKHKPEFLLIDGNRFKAFTGIEHACMVKGDSRFLSIAAASVLAKTFRDELMQKLHAAEPEYGWAQNKGYPTIAHRLAIAKYGVSSHHRLTFRLQKRANIETVTRTSHAAVQSPC